MAELHSRTSLKVTPEGVADLSPIAVRRPTLVRSAPVLAVVAASLVVIIGLAITVSPRAGSTAAEIPSAASMVTRAGANRDIGLIDRRLSSAWQAPAAVDVAKDGGPDRDIGLMDFSGR